MILKLKKTYVLLGTVWKVVRVAQALRDNGKKADGTADNSTKTIELSKDIDMSGKARRQFEYSRIFYHEFLHACFFEMGTDDWKFWNIDIEHSIINPLSMMFAHNFPVQMPN